MKKEIPSKEILEDLYLTQKKSIVQIIKILDSSHYYVYNALHQYNIPIRKDGGLINWSLQELLTKDFLIKKYIVEKLNIHKISKEVGCSISPIRRYLKLYNIPLRYDSWNKGLTKETDERVAKYGRNGSKTLKGRIPWNKDKEMDEKTKRKVSLACGGTGIPYENTGYGPDFTDALKEAIRHRDHYKCQLCGCPQIENGQKLDVHHIDYNKLHNILKNLIALCITCHRKTNHNRAHWITHFTQLLAARFVPKK